jgi:hypothetical protein
MPAQLTCLLHFPSSMSPLLLPILPHYRTVSHFLPIESIRAHCLFFISRQCFVPSPLPSNGNRSIESTPPPSTTYPDRLTPTLHCYKKVNSTLVTLPTTQMSLFCIFPSQSITPSELHPPSSFSFTVIPRSSSLRTATPMVIN